MKRFAFAAVLLAASIAHSQASELTQPRFENISEILPAEHVYVGGWEHFVGGGVAVFDCNGDSFPDFVAAGGTNPARLFRNDTEAPSSDMRFSLAKDFPELTGVTGAYPINVDGDDHTDLVILRVGENIVLRGAGACRFERANGDWGFAGGDAWSTSFSATWETGNDWPTLFIGNYVDRDDPEGPFEACDDNELHRPNTTGFAPPINIAPGFCALSALISDELRTGRRDLRISNDRHYYVRVGAEQKLRLDTLKFLTEEDGWPTVSLWGMGIAAQDLTGDGRAEVMSTSMGDQLLQIASETGYTNAPFSLGTYAQKPFVGDDGRPSTGWHAQFGDINNDGRADLFIAKGNVDQMPSNAMKDPNNLLVQSADGTFAETAPQAGVATTDRSRGAALADFDLDGRLDLVVVNRRAPLELYRNVTENTGAWLNVQVRSEDGNRDAIGSFVEVRTPDGLKTRERTIGGGHAGGQLLPEHFGLGDASAAEVQVTSPTGTIAIVWTSVPANSHCVADIDEDSITCDPTVTD